MIRAVLFDLDDTLLSINLAAFMARYTADLADLVARIGRTSQARAAAALARGYLAMADEARDDDLTNGRVMAGVVAERTGVDLADDAVAEALACYDREVLPRRRGRLVRAEPREGARELVGRARGLGLRVALATNPAFSEACIATRLGWAGIDPGEFELVSHLGNSRRLKPRARYFQEFVAELGLTPEECLMVGNDATRDFPRPDVGLRTAYVGHARPRRAVWRGSTAELARDLAHLVDRLDVEERAGGPGAA